jgi:hypothetical protein
LAELPCLFLFCQAQRAARKKKGGIKKGHKKAEDTQAMFAAFLF